MSVAGEARRGCGAASPRVAFVGLGFVTLTTQTVLLRELFSVLYGSDLAFAFALASWMFLTAAGALAAARCGRGPAGVVRWGNCLYTLVGLVVFLAVRAWGAQDVIPFHAYLLMPVFLAPLCLLGGMLFPLYLAAGPAEAATAYGWEVCGGLVAGAACAGLFLEGGLACPLLVGLVAVSGALALRGRPGCVGGVVCGLAVAAAVVPFTAPGRALERLSLRLRVRDGEIVDVVNTPMASLLAVRSSSGVTAVFENGIPWPAADPTPSRAAVAAVLWSLPGECRESLVVHAWRSGFAPALRSLSPGGDLRLVEADPLAVAFACRYDQAAGGARPRIQPFDPASLAAEGVGWDLAVVFSSGPAGLLPNRVLTREFARRMRARLSPVGLFAVALPVAPGFSHPGQEAWIDTVRRVFRDEFAATDEFRTELGWLLLVGSAVPVARSQAVLRLQQRFPGASPAVQADAMAVLQGRGEVPMDMLSDRAAPSRSGLASSGPANRVGAPRAYFGFLQFRGHLIEEAPAWWRWVFRERAVGWSVAVLAALCATGWGVRRARRAQGVFWAAWGATAALIFAVYLYQSLAGAAFWAVSLLSSVSLSGILCGTRCRPRPAADAAVVFAPILPAVLFPLYPLLERAPVALSLAGLLGAVGLCGAALGYVFARRGQGSSSPAQGGVLFAMDLLGGGAGLMLGGLLLPWWNGFAASALLAGSAAAAMLAVDTVRRRA